jgi:hypothetical protein
MYYFISWNKLVLYAFSSILQQIPTSVMSVKLWSSLLNKYDISKILFYVLTYLDMFNKRIVYEIY